MSWVISVSVISVAMKTEQSRTEDRSTPPHRVLLFSVVAGQGFVATSLRCCLLLDSISSSVRRELDGSLEPLPL